MGISSGMKVCPVIWPGSAPVRLWELRERTARGIENNAAKQRFPEENGDTANPLGDNFSAANHQDNGDSSEGDRLGKKGGESMRNCGEVEGGLGLGRNDILRTMH
jgi:hypothetical protein